VYPILTGVTMVAAVMVAGAWYAIALGVKAGRASERVRHRRFVHDTVLQSLEAMSLPSTMDSTDPVVALSELRAAARGEAARLRRSLVDPPGEQRRTDLVDALAEPVDEACSRGLRVEVAAAPFDAHVDPVAVAAVRDAVREALTNAAKHSGASSAVLRVAPTNGGVAVVVRDHGRGFAPGPTRSGFGLRQSIVGRMRDAGGRATVESSPGNGTRVLLWVPANRGSSARRAGRVDVR
jgi:signal transduction histidine kinase